MPSAKLSLLLQSSAPVNVPALASRRKFDAEIGSGGDDDDEVLGARRLAFFIRLSLLFLSVFRSGVCVWVFVIYFFWVLFVIVIFVIKCEKEE